MAMSSADDKRRVLLAVTETSPLPELWKALTEHLAGAPAELITIFVSDDRWRRAASLPFTREISRVSGRAADFTLQRAEQIDKDTAGRTQLEIQQLAAKSGLSLVFEILSENNLAGIYERLPAGQVVLIAPAFIANRPIYAELTRLKCQILLVETAERSDPDNQQAARPRNE